MKSARNIRAPKHRDLVQWAGSDNVLRLQQITVDGWLIPVDAIDVLTVTGLPHFGSLFVPDPQRGAEPRLPLFYLLGREELHAHLADSPLDCGCAYFGVRERTGEVWQLFPDGDIAPLFVNTSLAHFTHFLHRLGAAKERYRSLPDDDMMRRYGGVITRLIDWDNAAFMHPSSFWGIALERPWG